MLWPQKRQMRVHTYIHFFNFIYSDCQTKMPKSANPGNCGTLNRIVILHGHV